MLDSYEVSGAVPTIASTELGESIQASHDYQASEESWANIKAEVEKTKGVCENDEDVSVECQDFKKKEQMLVQTEEIRNKAKDFAQKQVDEYNSVSSGNQAQSSDLNNLLACGIKTGRISLAMVPYFITYLSNFILGLMGLISVLFIVIGGYLYIFGGLTDDKEKGKKAILNALKGMVVAILAWVIVTAVITFVTS